MAERTRVPGEVGTAPARRPDFIVIGAMKCGTTTLFQWLDDHPDCRLSPDKEPHFFSRDREFRRGPEPYLALFADAPPGLVTGEASASYADPRIAPVVARRIHELAPEVKLIYLVRDPVARLKSHYLHEWQRSRERRPFPEALRSPDNPYVAMSRYADAARPFVEQFGRERLLVVATEALAGVDSPGWAMVTDHLGIARVPGKADRANVSATKIGFSPLLLRVWESGMLEHVRRVPSPVRRLGRSLLRGRTAALHRQAAAVAAAVVPPDLAAELGEQLRQVQLLSAGDDRRSGPEPG